MNKNSVSGKVPVKHRIMCFICIPAICIMLVNGCSDGNVKSVRIDNDKNSVEKVLSERMAEEDSSTVTDTSQSDTNKDISGQVSDKKDSATEPIQDNRRQTGVSDDAPVPEYDEPIDQTPSAEGIDIDLTQLSGNMVYSEVYYMLVMPEEYMGKTIRMSGTFYPYHDELTGKDYFACVIMDATACCANGLEFELPEEYTYPDHCPDEGAEIEVTGVFDLYEEDDDLYCILRNAAMKEI
ncbi:MAG: hypothetical protein K6E85_00285 [Lachnospiraceae bacterium]|nr:hypothetical protein [Lachnospiraceae bacterium]